MMKRYFSFALFIALILSACAPAMSTPIYPAPVSEIPSPTAQPDESPSPVSGGGYPPAVFEAQKILSEKLNTPVELIKVDSIEPVEWPDSCLGVSRPGEMCAEVITPGFRILLRVDLAQYEFHTNADGSSIRQVERVLPHQPGESAQPSLLWQSSVCDQFSVTMEAAFFGKCGEVLIASPAVAPGAVEKVTEWLQTYTAFDADTPAGKVSLRGFGPNVATPSEQRMMAEWAQLNFDIALSGRAGAAWGLAFSYSRSGGFAGFCDDVGVYLAGYAYANNCKGVNGVIPLTATQLKQIFDWFDTYSQIDYTYTDPAVADAMTIRLGMSGKGSVSADEETTRAIVEFCADLLAQASFQQQADPSELKAAESAITEYLTALNSGDYILGAKLYGGDTSILETWNPDITNDLPALFERACTQNGLVCLLPRSITYRGPDSEGALQFIVEYNNPDGTLFQQGPCCGDENGMVSTSFLVRARQQGDLWLVLDLPPYVP